VPQSALDQAVQARVARQQADRDSIKSLLRRADVREIAEKSGLSIVKAEAAVSLLQDDELRELAQQARQAENDLAGGASTIVISTTTIIIVLLIIILIVVIAD
jgi:predicted xylose isomerase-like sugar epimerase